jgi:hypothetical protein
MATTDQVIHHVKQMTMNGPLKLEGGMFDGATVELDAGAGTLTITDDTGYTQAYGLLETWNDEGGLSRSLSWVALDGK